jgi:hypothetical protein
VSSSGRGDKPTANGGARRARAHADSASPPISRPDILLMGSGTETTATAKLFLKDGRLTGMPLTRDAHGLEGLLATSLSFSLQVQQQLSATA